MSKKTKDSWVRMINVSEPVLHKKGYTLYKVTSKVYPKNSVEAVTEVTVWKRYNDFKKLHKALSTLHQSLYLKGNFPPFAKTRIFGRFEPDVIEERRKSAEQLLHFAANYSPLFTSQVFVKFFEEGYSVVNPNSNILCEKSKLDDVLQPQPVWKLSDNVDPIIPKGIEENHSPNDNQLLEPVTPLGGIWQHHQVPDTISLGSHCTDDDDRTTFTDDENNTLRPPLSIVEFDPLLQTNSKSSNKQEELCNSWLLSTLQSSPCLEVERECVMDFPTPFNDFEMLEECVPKVSQVDSLVSRGLLVNNELSKGSHFSFDIPASVAQEALKSFDPLEIKTNDSQEDAHIYDRFAMTPNSDKDAPSKRPLFLELSSKYVLSAQEAKRLGQHKEEFEFYKKAIDVLLQGCQKDENSEMQESIKKKILLYLMRAEELYENKLPKSASNENMHTVFSSLHLSSKTKVKLQGSGGDLCKYKVLGVMDKVLLVLDVSTDNTFIVKTLYKSHTDKIIGCEPTSKISLPFVIRLHYVFETDYALFLILEHATGGRLWDYVGSFLQRSPLSPCNDGTCLYTESKTKVDLCNVYSGKKVVSATGEEVKLRSSVESDSVPSENCPPSYVALFKKYADTADEQENVSLAKYKRVHPSFQDKNRLFDGQHSDDGSRDVLRTMNLLSPPKSSRNRLSSSTGSLETTFSQKACNLEVLQAMDDISMKTASKSHLPESCVAMWAAEIVLALEALHNLGIIWKDFHPHNILLGEEGHILLTYQRKWKNINCFVDEIAKENFFCAPEVGGIFPITSDCDWWSTGAILFELLTGQSLKSCHPTGITRHTVLNFPTDISSDAKDFIVKLLQYNPAERLGSGIYGVEEIKSHPFFRDIDWRSLLR